jgi:dienelactone hydrolase
MWHADNLLEGLYDQAAIKLKQKRQSELPDERKNNLKQMLQTSLGNFEMNESHSPVLLEHVVCDGYIRERVELSAVPDLSFAAYILIPEKADKKLPAVLAIHGHGYGSREIVGLLPDGTPDIKPPGIHQHFAIELVKRGMVVIAPDVVGFGERQLLKQYPESPSSCYTLSTHLMMLGKTLTGLRVAEIRKALDYLYSREEVDQEQIGTMGFSGGALLAHITAALDERIKAAVLTGYPNTFKDSIMAVSHCLDNYIPGILLHTELPELIGLISPRPLFLESASNDPIFPVEGFKKAVEEVRSIYQRDAADNQLAVDLFPGVHEISGRQSYDWLKRSLS